MGCEAIKRKSCRKEPAQRYSLEVLFIKATKSQQNVTLRSTQCLYFILSNFPVCDLEWYWMTFTACHKDYTWISVNRQFHIVTNVVLVHAVKFPIPKLGTSDWPSKVTQCRSEWSQSTERTQFVCDAALGQTSVRPPSRQNHVETSFTDKSNVHAKLGPDVLTLVQRYAMNTVMGIIATYRETRRYIVVDV